jgi:hypothetical protein
MGSPIRPTEPKAAPTIPNAAQKLHPRSSHANDPTTVRAKNALACAACSCARRATHTSEPITLARTTLFTPTTVVRARARRPTCADARASGDSGAAVNVCYEALHAHAPGRRVCVPIVPRYGIAQSRNQRLHRPPQCDRTGTGSRSLSFCRWRFLAPEHTSPPTPRAERACACDSSARHQRVIARASRASRSIPRRPYRAEPS